PDRGRNFPGARAFAPFGKPWNHRDAGHVRQPESVVRTIALDQNRARGNAELGEIDVHRRSEQVRIGDMDNRMRLERGTDPLVCALDFQRAGNDATNDAQLTPLLSERVVAPAMRHGWKRLKVYRLRGRIARQPRLLRRE